MINKIKEPATTTEDFKDSNAKYSLNKFDYDLYHDTDDIAFPVIRVKRVNMPNNGEKWKVMSDNKVIFIIEGNKVSKKEREFLETVEGFNFILSQAKNGIKSLNGFRAELKKIVGAKSVNKKKIIKPVAKKKKKIINN